MRLSDGTILMHDNTPYDPVKAHEYYIRTRHLKGRHRGRSALVQVPKGSSTYTVKLRNGKTVTLTRQQLVEQEAYAAKRVSEIKNRLNELVDKFKQMMKEAEKKSSSNKKPTAADKAKAAKESKQYRQKHKQELKNKAKTKKEKTPSKKTVKKTFTVEELKSKITEIKASLKAAIQTQRALATAKKNI